MTTSSSIIESIIDDGLYSDDIGKMLECGWIVAITSCDCGGRYAWMMPRESGSMEMFGCICHRTGDAMLRFSSDPTVRRSFLTKIQY